LKNAVADKSSAAQENVRKYFREVLDSQNLPSLPVVAGKLLEMVRDPNVSARQLCRVLSDDPALVARVLAASRSPHFAQRTLPTDVLSAVQVLGLQNLTNIVMANAAYSLCVKGNPVSEKLWNHSLAVALAMRILYQWTGHGNGDLAFLAGLMHDVGEMILAYGDPGGFANLEEEVLAAQCQMMDKEQEAYGFDHTLIGLTLLDSWNLDSRIGQAVLNHHSEVAGDGSNELPVTLSFADYLCFQAGLGFFAAPPHPPELLLAKYGCDNDEGMGEALRAIRQAYEEERALFKPAH